MQRQLLPLLLLLAPSWIFTLSSIAIIAMVEDHHGEHNQATAASKLPSQPLIEAFNSSDNHLQLVHENNTSSIKLGSAPSADQTTTTKPEGQTSSLDGGNATTRAQQQQLLFTSYPTSTKKKKSLQVPMIWQEKFLWDQVEQGQILGAFFYGYILFQIPGARMAESAGAKWIIMAASAGSAVISLIFPLSTQLNSIYLLMALRFLMGLCQSGFFPAAYVLSCRWFPERERAVLLSIMFIGGNIGSISTYIMSSYLVSSTYGWPSVFYVSGGICSIFSLLWLVFGSSVPGENWLITEEERQFIELDVNMHSSSSSTSGISSSSTNYSDESGPLQNQRKSIGDAAAFCVEKGKNLDDQTIRDKRRLGLVPPLEQKLFVGVLGPPLDVAGAAAAATLANKTAGAKQLLPPEPSWFKLTTSTPVWTLILSMYGNEWSTAVICYELPTYLNTALNFPIEQNGFINSFFQLTSSLASPIMSSLGAYLLATSWLGMRKVHVRKLFQSLATFGQMICFVSVPICGPNRGLIIMFMFSAVIFKACAYAGDLMVPGDLSPDYAGTIFAFCNSIGNTAGFFVPTLTGVFVTNAYQREQWAPFWFTSATIMACSGIIFIVFGETRRQDFSLDGAGGCIELEETDGKLKNSGTQKSSNGNSS